MLKLTHRLGLRVLWAVQAGSEQACSGGGRGSAPQPEEGGRGVTTMPRNPAGWWDQPSSPVGVILSSAAADPTDGFLRSGDAESSAKFCDALCRFLFCIFLWEGPENSK